MGLTFCGRCGAQQKDGDKSHFAGPCEHARIVDQGELSDGTHVRCPVEGCKFRTALQGKPESVRVRFDEHLAWHQSNGVVAPSNGQAAQPLARLEQLAAELGCSAGDVAAARRVLARVLGLE